MYKVIIVEDDPMVAELNRQFIEREETLKFAGVFRNGAEAMEYLRQNSVDLVILDYYMPVMDGRELITACHKERLHPDFIMITAANYADDVSEIMHLGVVDYLVKPFTAVRFRMAVDRFLERKGRMQTEGQMTQEEIDHVLAGNTPPDRGEILEKGLQKKTLTVIKEFLEENRSREFSSNEVAQKVNLSRITVRRYMNYLLEKGEVASRIDYMTGGRPSIKYRMK